MGEEVVVCHLCSTGERAPAAVLFRERADRRAHNPEVREPETGHRPMCQNHPRLPGGAEDDTALRGETGRLAACGV